MCVLKSYRYHCSEQDEWRFMKEVTRDIIIAQSCSERMLFHIFSQAIKRWRNKLPVVSVEWSFFAMGT